MDSPIAANVLGTTSAVCWSVQLLPQILLNYRRHNATGLQPSMMMLWAWAGVPLGVYNIVLDFNIALQVQAQILAFLSLLTWAQVYYYEHKWSLNKCFFIATPIGLAMGAIEYGLIFALRTGTSRGVTWPTKLMAVLAALFLALGVLRHYWDIYTHRTVRGVSFVFCFIDALGDLTAILSILLEPRIDALGIVIYAVELCLWCGIFAAGGYYNFRAWLKKRKGRASGDGLDLGSEQERRQAVGMQRENDSSTSAFRTASRGEHENRQPRQRHGIFQAPLSQSTLQHV
ncbi:PQ loop repeat-containing protein 3 [Elsinoe australis]|uniref:PQ loop repeat-containing protein 3 n=1 Tax=Elsinoe australis TaxID=40998 RepID=A0A4V6DV25_9PEZI|nr:PQ loop repeat-containing protein 3 [Elsinoe australis]